MILESKQNANSNSITERAMQKVLVTGATGFVASHLILALLDEGYAVRGTIRSLAKGEQLLKALTDYAGRQIDIELVEADLSTDDGWAAAMEGVDFVQHVASPFPAHQPATADELIVPARDGALRVLHAANAAGVRRIVMTSSVAAVDVAWEGQRPAAFNESHWTNMSRPEKVSFYAQSKTIAEKAAWEAVSGEGFTSELSVIVPTVVLGPAMSRGVSASLGMITASLKREMPAFPKLHQGIIDVRDLAKAHVEAMRREEAAGERIIVCSESLWFKEIGEILQDAHPDRRMPKGELPNWLVRFMSRFRPELKLIAPNLGRPRNYDTRKAKALLGMEFRPAQEAILASADSVEKLGLV